MIIFENFSENSTPLVHPVSDKRIYLLRNSESIRYGKISSKDKRESQTGVPSNERRSGESAAGVLPRQETGSRIGRGRQSGLLHERQNGW